MISKRLSTLAALVISVLAIYELFIALPALKWGGESSWTAIVLCGDDALIAAAKAKLGFLVHNFTAVCDTNVSEELCKTLLGLSVSLPAVILVEDGRVRAVIIGTPSERLWDQVLEKLSKPSGAFLAYSVPEGLLPWRCASCPQYERSVEEGLCDLTEWEAAEVVKVLRR